MVGVVGFVVVAYHRRIGSTRLMRDTKVVGSFVVGEGCSFA